MKFILGPCPCQGCRKLVWWGGLYWCDGRGKKHACAEVSLRKDNQP